MKFVLLLTLWHVNYQYPNVSVLGYDLTAQECIDGMVAYNDRNPEMTDGTPSCEFDFGEPWDELPESGVFNE